MQRNNEKATVTVSIVMCTYNGAQYIAQQLDTILAQTYPLHEIIIQDDGSRDGTWDILTAYAERHAVIHLFRHEGEHGLNNNFISAVQRATGEFIAFSDQDDLWEKDKIARQVDALQQSGAWLCSHKSRPFSDDVSSIHYDKRRPNIGLLRLVFQAETFGHTQLFHHKLTEVLTPNLPLLRYSAYDVLIPLAAAATKKIVFINEPLTHFRRHGGAATLTNMSTSSHTTHNALHQVWFCLRHYRILKRRSRPDYLACKEFLESLPYDTTSKADAIRMLTYQTQYGPLNFMRYQWFCLCHRHEIFYTPGKGIINALRAWMYPVLCLHYKRRYAFRK